MSYRPPKGETTHYILRVASAPSPTAVTDSLDFQVADAPLQIQFASAKCVRCASLRSGGRRLAVRTAMEHPTGALPRTPFPASRDFPSRGNERYEGKNRESYISCTIPQFPPLVASAASQSAELFSCHMIQKSKSRNADFILIAREGDTTTLGAKGSVKLKNPPAVRPVHLKNLSL